MTRAEAAKLIKEHLGEYSMRLQEYGPRERLNPYGDTDHCPLCNAAVACMDADDDGDPCELCLTWPGGKDGCIDFLHHINPLKSVHGKRRWIDKLFVALDEWVEE